MTRTRPPHSPDYQEPDHTSEPLEEPTPNVRQGVTGHNVRYVLAISIVAVVALFVIIYLLFFAG